jgi:hypothetical protein
MGNQSRSITSHFQPLIEACNAKPIKPDSERKYSFNKTIELFEDDLDVHDPMIYNLATNKKLKAGKFVF